MTNTDVDLLHKTKQKSKMSQEKCEKKFGNEIKKKLTKIRTAQNQIEIEVKYPIEKVSYKFDLNQFPE